MYTECLTVHGSPQCYLPLAQPPGVQRRWHPVSHGHGRAEPGIFLSQMSTNLQGPGKKIRQPQCSASPAHEENDYCTDGSRKKRGIKPSRERRQPHLRQQFHAWLFLGIVWHQRDTHLALFPLALKGQVLYPQQ